jgi:hypothetical protein
MPGAVAELFWFAASGFPFRDALDAAAIASNA